MLILNIYGARAIVLLFYNDKDTLSTECEIKMIISQQTFRHNIIPKTSFYIDIKLYKRGKKYCGNSSYLWKQSHFKLFYDDQETLSTYCQQQMIYYKLIFTNNNISKALREYDIFTIES